jgi:replicative DNA helicase
MSRFDAESAVLGACLIDQQAFWLVADLIGPDDFSGTDNRALWTTIAELRKSGEPADFVTVGEVAPALADKALHLSSNSPGSASVRGYAEWVLQAATERRVQAAGHRIATLRGADAIGEAQRILGACQPRAMSAVKSIRDYLRESVQTMQQRVDAVDVLTGVPTSLDWLDEQTSGWQRTDLIIVAARPSVGKTALAIQCALHAAKVGHPVFFASLEQSGSQIAERAQSHISGVPLQHILQPKRIEDYEWTKIGDAQAQIAKLAFLIDETGALSADAICARARQANAANRLGLIVIDYLTQITPPKADKMADAIQMITRMFKALAKELAVPIILLSQLNRDGDQEPVLKNLRDSGAIEQDADVVIFLHRPNAEDREHVKLIIAKQRNGPCDSTYLSADMARMRFTPTEYVPTQPRSRGNGFIARSAQTDR